MRRVVLSEVLAAIPELDELHPAIGVLLEHSEPDPARIWSGSGILSTSEDRILDPETVGEALAKRAAGEARHLASVYEIVTRVAKAVAEGLDDRAALALLEAAALEEARDRADRAAAYARAAVDVARSSEDPSVRSLALRRLARALRAMGRLGDAAARYREGFQLAEVAGDVRGAAEAAIGEGNVFEEQGRWAEAAVRYRSALETLDAIGEPTSETWHALLNLHIVTRSTGDLDESLSLLDRAEEVAKSLGEWSPAFANARAQLAMAERRFEAAEASFRQALSAAEGAIAAVTIRLNLAECLLARGRTLEAAEETREAERAAIRSGRIRKLPEAYRLLGRIAGAEGNPDAFVLFERALELARTEGVPVVEEATTLQAYAEWEASHGDEASASARMALARERFDSVGISELRHPWVEFYGKDGDGDE